MNCVARTSLDDAIQRHLPRSSFQLRMICNKACEWTVALAFDRDNWKSERTGWIDKFISPPSRPRAGVIAVITKETAGMFALEIATR